MPLGFSRSPEEWAAAVAALPIDDAVRRAREVWRRARTVDLMAVGYGARVTLAGELVFRLVRHHRSAGLAAKLRADLSAGSPTEIAHAVFAISLCDRARLEEVVEEFGDRPEPVTHRMGCRQSTTSLGEFCRMIRGWTP